MSGDTRNTVTIQGFALRLVRGLSQVSRQELADAVGVDPSYIGHMETAGRRQVSRKVYARILEELGVGDQRALLSYPPARDEDLS